MVVKTCPKYEYYQNEQHVLFKQGHLGNNLKKDSFLNQNQWWVKNISVKKVKNREKVRYK